MDRRTSVRDLKKCFENKNKDAEEISQPDKTNKHRPKDETSIDYTPKEETIDYRTKHETNDVGTNFPEKRISSKSNYYLSNLSYERPTLERLHSLNIEKVVAKIYDNVEHLQRCSLDSTLVTREVQIKELPSPEIVTIISRNNSEATPEKFKDYLEQNNKPKDEQNTKQVKFLSSYDLEEQKRDEVDEEASTNLLTVTDELSSPFWANMEEAQSFKEEEPINKYATSINNNVYSSKDGTPKTNSLKNELLLEELPLVIEPETKRKPKPQRNKSIKLSTKKQIKKPIFNLEDDGTVPKFVQFCVDQLNKHNLIETLGIYRSSPSYTIVMNLLSDLEKGRFKYEDLDESTILASALKSYFKYLQKPLLNVFQDYHLANGSDVEFCKEHVKEYLNKMQSIEKQTLIFLLIHLADVASKKTENLMDVQNIASVWSPCLLPTLNINSNDLFIYTNFQISLLEFLIREQNSLFDAKEVGSNRGIMPIAPVPDTKENKKKLCCTIL